MKEMEDRILTQGEVLPGHILKVGNFLNQQIDSAFLSRIGEEIASLFAESGVTKVMTIESSGIAIAASVGMAMNVPIIFAKKHKSSNVDGKVLSTTIHSYTHGNDYTAVVGADYLLPGERVLLVDDFLANGNALEGLIRMVEQVGATVVGAACAIEKGFQRGGDKLREKGYRIESLAIVDAMDDDGTVTFRR